MITESTLEPFDNLYQLICNNITQPFIITSSFKPNSEEIKTKWLLNLIGINNQGKEYFWFTSLTLNQIEELTNDEAAIVKSEVLMERMLSCWSEGGLTIQDFKNVNVTTPIQLIFNINASLTVSIPLIPCSSLPKETISPWSLLEQIIPLSLTSIKHSKESISSKLRLEVLVKENENLKVTIRNTKEDLKRALSKVKVMKGNGISSSNRNGNKRLKGDDGVTVEGSTDNDGEERKVLKRAPPLQKGRRGLTTQDDMEIGVQIDSDDE